MKRETTHDLIRSTVRYMWSSFNLVKTSLMCIFSIHNDFAYHPFLVNVLLRWTHWSSIFPRLECDTLGGFYRRPVSNMENHLSPISWNSEVCRLRTGWLACSARELLARIFGKCITASLASTAFRPYTKDNPEFEVRSLILTPIPPTLVSRKRRLFFSACLDDFRQNSFFPEIVSRRYSFRTAYPFDLWVHCFKMMKWARLSLFLGGFTK